MDQTIVPTPTADDGPAVARRGRRPKGGRGRWAAAAAAVALAVGGSAAALSSGGGPEAPGVTGPRERAVLAAPYLGRSGSLPDQASVSVQDAPVPFTFTTPPRTGGQEWQFMNFGAFDIGDMTSGMTVLAPTSTYDAARPWRGQTATLPAPVDAAGWVQWLELTGRVEVTRRERLSIGGAAATRLTLDLAELPADFDCGGARRCLALAPMLNPHAGASAVGSGAQVGIEDQTREMTVIELEGRAVLALATGKPDSATAWLPTVRAVVDSLRFA